MFDFYVAFEILYIFYIFLCIRCMISSDHALLHRPRECEYTADHACPEPIPLTDQ